jgi:hypothetical protein
MRYLNTPASSRAKNAGLEAPVVGFLIRSPTEAIIIQPMGG